jgi:hypothetical protein
MLRMTPAKPIITPDRAEACIASALRVLIWLLGLILRIGAQGRSARLTQILSRAELGVECTLFVKAMAMLGPVSPRRRHPRTVPAGFRRVGGDRRLFFKRARIRAPRKAGPLARVLALFDAMARPERALAYFLKRLARGLYLTRLVAASPPADASRSLAALEPVFADTS